MGVLAELGEKLLTREMGIGGASGTAPPATNQNLNPSADPQANAISGVMDVINHPSVGGLAGLASLFQSKGMGQTLSGWTSNGPNPGISAGQLQQVLGSGPIAAFAQRLGIPQDQAASHLAQLLPHVVDHLTPNGSIPSGGTDSQNVISELKSHLFG